MGRGTSGHGGFGALRSRNYRMYVGGYLASCVGLWMQRIGQTWLVLQLTGDALMLGAVTAAQWLPVAVFGLFGGVLADQVSKRRVLVVSYACALLLALAMLGLTVSGAVEVWHVVALAALLGLVSAIESPARHAFAVEMVGRADMSSAIAINSAVFQGAAMIGPALAGMTIGIVGVAPTFALNGLGYAAAIASLLVMREADLIERVPTPHAGGGKGVIGDLAEGLRYVGQTRVVLLAMVTAALVTALAGNFQVLIPVLAEDVLRSGPSGYGFLMSAAGIGSLAAALGCTMASRLWPRGIWIGALTLGGSLVVLAISHSYAISFAAMLVAGIGNIVMSISANTTIQETVPDHLRGRAMSIYIAAWCAAPPAGGLVFGTIASRWDVTSALGIGGFLAMLVAAATFLRLRQLRTVRRASPAPLTAIERAPEPAACRMDAAAPEARCCGRAARF